MLPLIPPTENFLIRNLEDVKSSMGFLMLPELRPHYWRRIADAMELRFPDAGAVQPEWAQKIIDIYFGKDQP